MKETPAEAMGALKPQKCMWQPGQTKVPEGDTGTRGIRNQELHKKESQKRALMAAPPPPPGPLRPKRGPDDGREGELSSYFCPLRNLPSSLWNGERQTTYPKA